MKWKVRTVETKRLEVTSINPNPASAGFDATIAVNASPASIVSQLRVGLSDGTELGTIGSASGSLNWLPGAAGAFTLQVDALDAGGRLLGSLELPVTVNLDRDRLSQAYSLLFRELAMASAWTDIYSFPGDKFNKLALWARLLGRETVDLIHDAEITSMMGPHWAVHDPGAGLVGPVIDQEKLGKVRQLEDEIRHLCETFYEEDLRWFFSCSHYYITLLIRYQIEKRAVWQPNELIDLEISFIEPFLTAVNEANSVPHRGARDLSDPARQPRVPDRAGGLRHRHGDGRPVPVHQGEGERVPPVLQGGGDTGLPRGAEL